MLQLLGIAWSVWKLTAKRFGPFVGLGLSILAVGGYVALKRLESNR